jgi:hypothetical protein
MGRHKTHTNISVGKKKGIEDKSYFVDLCLKGKIILKWIIKKECERVPASTSVAYIRREAPLDHLQDKQLLKVHCSVE